MGFFETIVRSKQGLAKAGGPFIGKRGGRLIREAGLGKARSAGAFSSLVKARGGGPFIGPKGGKWADPQHKIPWKGSEGATQAHKERGKHHREEMQRWGKAGKRGSARHTYHMEMANKHNAMAAHHKTHKLSETTTAGETFAGGVREQAAGKKGAAHKANRRAHVAARKMHEDAVMAGGPDHKMHAGGARLHSQAISKIDEGASTAEERSKDAHEHTAHMIAAPKPVGRAEPKIDRERKLHAAASVASAEASKRHPDVGPDVAMSAYEPPEHAKKHEAAADAWEKLHAVSGEKGDAEKVAHHRSAAASNHSHVARKNDDHHGKAKAAHEAAAEAMDKVGNKEEARRHRNTAHYTHGPGRR